MTTADALVTRLSRVPVTAAKDVLRQLGVESAYLANVRPIAGAASPVAGPARTLRYLPARQDLGPSPKGAVNRQLIESLRPGDVMVADAMASRRGSVLGDMLATRVRIRGAAAVVTDGVVRDVATLAQLGLPVFAGGSHVDPAAAAGLVPWEMDVPIQCGGVLVMPGDWMLADADGVVVVPAGLAGSVADAAEEMQAAESYSQSLLEAGFSLDEAFPLPAHRRTELAAFLRDGVVPQPGTG